MAIFLRRNIIFILSTFIIAAMQAGTIEHGSQWNDGLVNFYAHSVDGHIAMRGETLHEGGFQFALYRAASTEADYVVKPYVLKEPNSLVFSASVKNGDLAKIITIGDETVMTIRGADDGKLKTILKPTTTSLEVVMRNDMLFMLANEYVDSIGRKWTFTENGHCQFAGMKEPQPYRVEEEFDMPTNILTVQGKSYFVLPSTTGLNLYEAKPRNYDFERGGFVARLRAVESESAVGVWPFAAKHVLNTTILLRYDKPTLRLMRNEIFARRGYWFESKELRKHFAAQPWYQPLGDNDNVELTPIEQLNVELIEAVEQSIDESFTKVEPGLE